jgi:hypothetical protein
MPRLALRTFAGSATLPAAGAPGVKFTTAPGANSITFETWVKITPALLAGTHAIATFENTTYSTGFLISQSGSDLILYKPAGGGGPSATYTGALAAYVNKWIHIAVVFTINGSNSSATAYINGVSLGTQAGLAAWNLSSGTLGLGGSVDGFNAPAGIYSATRFYLRALSAQDVLDRYRLGRDDAAMRASVLAQWDFAEQTGTTVADGSGNGNTGTFVSGAGWSTEAPMKARTVPAIAQNLVLWSEDLSNAAWTKTTGVTATANTADVPDPNGGATASKLIYDGSGAAGSFRIFQTAVSPGLLGATYQTSVWLRTLSGTATLRLTDNQTTQTITVTSTWQRFSVSSVWAGVTAVQLLLYSAAADNTPFTVYAWSEQVQEANWLGPYVKTTSAQSGGPIRSMPQTQQNTLKWSTLISASNYIDSSANVTVATGQADPFGGTTASRLTDSVDGAGTQHQLNQNVQSALAGLTCCASVYVKAGQTNPQFAIAPNGAAVQVVFDTSTGASSLVNNSDGSYLSRGMVAVTAQDGSTWYRCWVVYRPNAGFLFLQFYMAKTGALVYTGNGSGVSIIAGPQLVVGSAPGPYVATNATRVNGGTIRSAAAQAQNLFAWSTDLANAAWISVDQPITKTGGQADAFGGTTACRINDSAHTGTFRFSQTLNVGTGIGAFLTQTVYAKAGTKSWIFLGDSTTGLGAWFDLTNGVLGTVNTGITASIQAMGNGWFQCAVTSKNVTATTQPMFFLANGNGTVSYTGDGTGTVFFCAPQLVQANWVGPFTPTSAANVNSGTVRSAA